MNSKNDKKDNSFNKQRRNFIKTGTATAFAAFAVQSFSLSAETLNLNDRTRHFLSKQEQRKFHGKFEPLLGSWDNSNLPGRGFNMIALPYPKAQFAYRLLLNQYNESLSFKPVEQHIPNRGFPDDQFTTAVEYHQDISQVAAEDFPISGEAGERNLEIHHELGKFLSVENDFKAGFNIARLAVVPHGNTVLAFGNITEVEGMPELEDFSGLPIAVANNINSPYLAPYKHFHENMFKGVFNPVKPSEYLKLVNEGVNITKTTILKFDSRNKTGGIQNTPFLAKQAKVTELQSTFYIQELADLDKYGTPKLRLQYVQLVMLDFFQRSDGEGLVRWPHISINTLEKVIS